MLQCPQLLLFGHLKVQLKVEIYASRTLTKRPYHLMNCKNVC